MFLPISFNMCLGCSKKTVSSGLYFILPTTYILVAKEEKLGYMVYIFYYIAKARPPVDRLEVLDYEPDTRSLQLSWQRVEIPPYSADEEPLMYMVEYQEPPLPDWRPLVTGIPTTRYRVMHLDPERDYNFRVRALTPYGVSPPSAALPVSMRQPPTGI